MIAARTRLAGRFCLALGLGLLFCLALLPPGRAQGPEVPFASGELLVKFAPGLAASQVQQALRSERLTVLGTNERLGVLRLAVPPGQEIERAAALAARPDVLYAEPNYLVQASVLPDDPKFGNQWYLTQIRAPEAWDAGVGDSGQIIAVLDTGVDLDHPDLQAKLVPGYDFVNDDDDPDDDQMCNGISHGTHVAGIAAAATDNQTGVAGLAWATRVMPVKVLNNCGGGTYGGVADGVIYAVDHGADIINLSLGGVCPESAPQTLKAAIDYAYSQGVLVVAAAGNTAGPVLCPAAYASAIAVAATTESDSRAYFSNVGPEVEVAAPGVSIYSTLKDGSYGYKNGTSMATPIVAGLAALIWGEDPALTNVQVRAIITGTAIDLGDPGRDPSFGWGRVDAFRALMGVDPPALAVSDAPHALTDDSTPPTPAQTTVQVRNQGEGIFSWTATISPDVDWLTISPGTESGLSTASHPGQITLAFSRPLTYGTYSTSLIVTAESAVQTSTRVVTPQITYMAALHRVRFLLIFRNAPLP